MMTHIVAQAPSPHKNNEGGPANMLSHNVNRTNSLVDNTSETMLRGREDSESSAKTESEGGEAAEQKPNRKRKRKGLGNWTRTTLACNRCRKMKIRVSIYSSLRSEIGY